MPCVRLRESVHFISRDLDARDWSWSAEWLSNVFESLSHTGEMQVTACRLVMSMSQFERLCSQSAVCLWRDLTSIDIQWKQWVHSNKTAFIVCPPTDSTFVLYFSLWAGVSGDRPGDMKKRIHFILARALVGSQIYENIREPYWGLRVDDYYLRPRAVRENY